MMGEMPRALSITAETSVPTVMPPELMMKMPTTRTSTVFSWITVFETRAAVELADRAAALLLCVAAVSSARARSVGPCDAVTFVTPKALTLSSINVLRAMACLADCSCALRAE